MHNNGPLPAICITALLLARCSMVSLTGGSDNPDFNVLGVITDGNGRPAPDTHVMLIPCSYNPVTDGVPFAAMVDTTDGDGRYEFTITRKGDYTIQAVHLFQRTRLFLFRISVCSDTTRIAGAPLSVPGAVKVMLPTGVNGSTGYVYIPGTTSFVFLNNRTDFIVLDSVPTDTIPAVYYASTNSAVSTVIRYDVEVVPGDTAVVANPGWKYARRISLNTSATGAGVSGTVADLPVLIRLTSGNINFTQANTNGGDIRFARSDTALLPYEIERWDPVTELAEVWVSVDTVFGNDSAQFITLYWGNPDAISSSNSTEVFDTAGGFAGVWHMNENPAAGANSIKDRTANCFNATPHGSMTAADVVDGAIGKALDFDGNNDYLNAGNVNLTGSYSVGLWVNANDLTTYRRFVFKQIEYTLWYDIDTKGIRMEHYDGTRWRGIMQDGGTPEPMITGVWYYIVGTYDRDKVRLYVNGELITTSNSIGADPQENSNYLSLGDGETQRNASGIMDEIRIEKTDRSADWIKLSYMNQRSDDKLVVFK